MRIMLFSMAVVTAVTAYGFSNQKSSDEIVKNAEQIIENINYHQFDHIVTGVTISREHLLKWHERKRKNALCNGCLDESQPYPGDDI